jgi:hypothetical protein
VLLHVHDWIGDLLEAQVENLEVLWGQWMDGRRSNEWALWGIRRLEERIEAHVDALILAEDRTDALLLALLGQGFAASDLAAGYSLLKTGRPEMVDAAMTYFSDVDPTERDGITMALRLGPIDPLRQTLDSLASQDDDAMAAAAGLVLVSHGLPLPQPGRLAMWRRSEEPAVARDAWLATALLPRKHRAGTGFSEYRPGLEQPNAELRDVAYFCGAVCGGDWVRAHARDHAKDDAVAARWFAITGQPEDAPKFTELLGKTSSLGVERFDVAASFGHPSVVPTLLEAMGSEDPITAVAAGRAFSRMTGQDVESPQRVALLEDPDDDPDFADEAYLPDAARARAWWDGNRGRITAGTRWLGGVDLGVLNAVLGDDIDMQTRFEHRVRSHFEAKTAAETREFDRFPW